MGFWLFVIAFFISSGLADAFGISIWLVLPTVLGVGWLLVQGLIWLTNHWERSRSLRIGTWLLLAVAGFTWFSTGTHRTELSRDFDWGTETYLEVEQSVLGMRHSSSFFLVERRYAEPGPETETQSVLGFGIPSREDTWPVQASCTRGSTANGRSVSKHRTAKPSRPAADRATRRSRMRVQLDWRSVRCEDQPPL